MTFHNLKINSKHMSHSGSRHYLILISALKFAKVIMHHSCIIFTNPTRTLYEHVISSICLTPGKISDRDVRETVARDELI